MPDVGLTPRARAIFFLNALKEKFSPWMEDFDEFDDLKQEVDLHLQVIGSAPDAELATAEEDRLSGTLGELKAWADRLTGLNPARAGSRNELVAFIGNRRWTLYYPDLGENIGAPINLRPIGNDGIRFNIHEKEDVGFVKTASSNLNHLQWEFQRVELDNQPSVLVGSIPAWELELASTVPAIESKISKNEVASRILNEQRAKSKWQRQISKKNRESIASFFDRQGSFFANPVILHDPESSHITYSIDEESGNASVKISLDFLRNGSSLVLIDEDMADSRPLTIIDGQHRIRGAALAPNNFQQKLLVVLLPPQIAESTAGRLFAEINTLSKPLPDRHRLFLAHRFKVSSPDAKFTFGEYVPEERNFRDRANRMSYQFAALLASRGHCALLDQRIRFLDQNKSSLIDIPKWIEFTYPWFLEYPFTESNPSSNEDILSELTAYFDAWHDLIGEETWSSDEPCLFKSSTQFRVILTRFKQVYELAKAMTAGELIPKQLFAEVLSPLANVPFSDLDVFEAYNDGGETPWQCLDAWVFDALKHRSSASTEQILDTSLLGGAGMGIISAPLNKEEHQVDIPSDGLYPTNRDTKYLKVYRPMNCRTVCRVRVGFENRYFKRVSVQSKEVEQSANIPIRMTRDIENIRQGLFIEIEWETINSKVVNRIEIN